MMSVNYAVEVYRGHDGRAGFVIVEDGQQWPRLFASADEAADEVDRRRAGLPPPVRAELRLRFRGGCAAAR